MGIDLPSKIKIDLAALIDMLRPAAPQAKWVPRDNLHLTLSFLGEVKEERLEEMRSALARAALSIPGPIETSLKESGAFPSVRRARVLWVGLADQDGRLGALAGAVASGLEPLGFAPEKRAWTPHLTLARFRVPGDASQLLGAMVPETAFAIPEATLFRSRLARPAPAYEALERFPLGGRSRRLRRPSRPAQT